MREQKLLCLQAGTGDEWGGLRWADISMRGTLSQRSKRERGLCWCLLIYHRLHLSRNQGGAWRKFPPGENQGGFAVCWRPKCEQLSMATTQAPSSCMILKADYFSIVLNLLLSFVFTNVHTISSMGKPRLVNESWAAKAKLSYECKMEFYRIAHFIIIMMNCDCFPGKKWQYL